jgi:DHA2 family multidrug resistance protein-like MFS transporter
MSLGVALLRFIVPQRQLGTAIGWNALAVALASAAGPTIGAFVLSAASWPWLFAVNMPLGALVLLATRALPSVPGSARKLDVISVSLNALAFATMVVGAELMPVRPALGASVLAVAAVSMLSLVRRERPRALPLVPLDLLGDASFRVSVAASVCCFVGQSAALVALPFYLEHGLGLTTLRTGLLITPWPLTVALVAPIAGRLARPAYRAPGCARWAARYSRSDLARQCFGRQTAGPSRWCHSSCCAAWASASFKCLTTATCFCLHRASEAVPLAACRAPRD